MEIQHLFWEGISGIKISVFFLHKLFLKSLTIITMRGWHIQEWPAVISNMCKCAKQIAFASSIINGPWHWREAKFVTPKYALLAKGLFLGWLFLQSKKNSEHWVEITQLTETFTFRWGIFILRLYPFLHPPEEDDEVSTNSYSGEHVESKPGQQAFLCWLIFLITFSIVGSIDVRWAIIWLELKSIPNLSGAGFHVVMFKAASKVRDLYLGNVKVIKEERHSEVKSYLKKDIVTPVKGVICLELKCGDSKRLATVLGNWFCRFLYFFFLWEA